VRATFWDGKVLDLTEAVQFADYGYLQCGSKKKKQFRSATKNPIGVGWGESLVHGLSVEGLKKKLSRPKRQKPKTLPPGNYL